MGSYRGEACALEAGSGGDADVGVKVAQAAGAVDLLNVSEQSEANAAATVRGIDVKHVDVTVGFEVGEACDVAAGFGDEGGFGGVAGDPGWAVDRGGSPCE